MSGDVLTAERLVDGTAEGPVLHSDVPLSFWGGVDPFTGMVIDTHHPLRGETLTGRILAIPSGRGSCGGSGAIFEMLLGGTAPVALVFSHPEPILTLGVAIAGELFGRQIPVVRLDGRDFARLGSMAEARVVGSSIIEGFGGPPTGELPRPSYDARQPAVALSDLDRRFLDGDFGEAARVAMKIVVRAAELEGADELVDVARAHVDGVFYQGPASLAFATTLRDLGGTVRVPTTMNSICVDRRRWREQGVEASMGEPSEDLADAYEQMGARPTYTCAPYLLRERAGFGEQVASAESNAVVFTNSVLGARTMKYPDYLDILIALTGRAPKAGPHLDAGRRATVRVDVEAPPETDGAFFATLGYHVGALAPHDIPAVCGLEDHRVSEDDLKAFGAAFATTSAAAMFHIVGTTPEAATVEQATGDVAPSRRFAVDAAGLRATWHELSNAVEPAVDLVSLGNPHFSLAELGELADLLAGRRVVVPLVVTCGREVYERARELGYVGRIEAAGGSVINDTCWCFIREPIVPAAARTVATDSGKFAHYGAAGLGRGMHLRSLSQCVEAACTGRVPTEPPRWLR